MSNVDTMLTPSQSKEEEREENYLRKEQHCKERHRKMFRDMKNLHEAKLKFMNTRHEAEIREALPPPHCAHLAKGRTTSRHHEAYRLGIEHERQKDALKDALNAERAALTAIVRTHKTSCKIRAYVISTYKRDNAFLPSDEELETLCKKERDKRELDKQRSQEYWERKAIRTEAWLAHKSDAVY